MKKYILTLILALASLGLYAQTNRNKTIINAALHGWEYEIKAGVNLGGTAPLLSAQHTIYPRYLPLLECGGYIRI